MTAKRPPTRRPITERMKIDALLCLAWDDDLQPRGINCICGDPIIQEDAIEWDHAVPLSRGGEHTFLNIRPLHRECHKRKTFRPRGGATTIGGDNYEAKKTARLEQKVAGTWKLGQPKRKLPKRHNPWGKRTS